MIRFIFLSGVLSAQGDQNKRHSHIVKSVKETYKGSATSMTTDLKASFTPSKLGGNYISIGFCSGGNGNNGNLPPYSGNFCSADGRASIESYDGYNDVQGAFVGAAGGLTSVRKLEWDFNHNHDYNHSHKMDSDGGDEARPKNYTVRIWKRIN